MIKSTIRRRSDSFTTFLIDVSQNPIVQRQIRQNLLALRILMLQLIQTPNFQRRHAAEFVPPAIESLFGDLVFPAETLDRDVAFRLLENFDDFLFVKILYGQGLLTDTLHIWWSKYSGAGHSHHVRNSKAPAPKRLITPATATQLLPHNGWCVSVLR